MDFYQTVNEENALEWYQEVPPHLKSQIDVRANAFKSGFVCTPSELPSLYATVTKELGARPAKPADPVDNLEGWSKKQLAQWEAHKAWANRYDELKLIGVIIELAPTLQKERRMLNQALGIGNVEGFPVQAEGLDDTQAATVRWIQETGQTPIEFLAETYRDPEQKASDRIAAARAMLDFVHRKIPSVQKVEQDVKLTEAKLNGELLKGLSEKELNTLEALLNKVNKV